MNDGVWEPWGDKAFLDDEALDSALRQLTPRELDEILALLKDQTGPSVIPESPIWVRPESRVRPGPPIQVEPFTWPKPVMPKPPVQQSPSAQPEPFTWPEPIMPEPSVQPEPPVQPGPPDWLFAQPEAPARPEPFVQPEPPIQPEPLVRDSKLRRELFEWIRALVSAIVFVGMLNLFFVRIIGVSGDSMNPTLEDGQRLLISNLFYRPAPGDIIIFAGKDGIWEQKSPEDKEPLVKRVIAVEGQVVDIDFNTGGVFVDDQLQNEPYIKEFTYRVGDLTFPLAVPPGCLFVMGDNRNDSLDSRWSVIGLVDERYVLGHVLLCVWPFGALGRI